MTHPMFDPHSVAMESVDPLSASAFKTFKRSMMLHRRLLMSMFAEEAVHPAQAACLMALDHMDGMSQSDLADALHVSRPTVTTMLQKLEGAGTITRRDDEADSRITRVYLTPEGRLVTDRMHTLYAEMINVSVGSLPEDDRRELDRLLGELNSRAEAALAERGVSACSHPHGHGSEGAR